MAIDCDSDKLAEIIHAKFQLNLEIDKDELY